ncbi:MAG: GyrI-like domain-containing protein, partial [Candidatus Omnitrophica bacterium]|nr:GyrI-like domain-containing protein [Candidatus Omnitrophota bacterium]
MRRATGILVVILIGIVLVLGFTAYMGVFSKVAVNEVKTGPYTYAYMSFVGPYDKTGAVFNRVHQSLERDGIKTQKALGVYYDDPKSVPPNKQRSDCGWVLEASDFGKLPKLLEKYSIRTLPAKDRVTAVFPLRNSFSYMVG